MEKNQAEYEQRVPAIQKEVEELEVACTNLEKEISNKTDEIKDFETNLLKLDIKEDEVKGQLVTEEDYKKRKDAVLKLEEEIVELQKTITDERNDYNTSSVELDELSKMFENIKKALEKHELSHYKSLM